MENRIYNIAGINICFANMNPGLFRALDKTFGTFVNTNTKKADIYIQRNQWNETFPEGVLVIEQRNEAQKRYETIWKTSSGYLFHYKYDTPLRTFYFSVSYDFTICKIYSQNHFYRTTELSTVARVAFLLYAIKQSSLLFHASCIVKEGKAVLFHAPSGTGKSTHSQQWMKAFPDTELLNDDGPVVRVWPDGRVIAYGSPWSGKTPCYKNLSAPVAAFVRINRAQKNEIHRLSPVQAYASLLPSCATNWNEESTEIQYQILNKIIATIPCYQLDCLPNEDAARVCAAEVLKGYEYNK